MTTTLLLIAALWAGSSGEVEADDLAPLLDRGHESLFGTGRDGPARPTLQLSGGTTRHGTRADFRWTFDPGGRFLRELRGQVLEREVFDGVHAWREEGRGPSWRLALLERERLLAESWVIAGLWCLEDGPFEVVRAAQGPALELRLKDGLWRGTLELDADTGLPSQLTVAEDFGGDRWSFEDWGADPPRLPGRLVWTPAQGAERTFEVRDARVWERRPPDYARPRRSRGDVHFSPDTPAELDVRRVESGHLFVRPRVNGEDLGWFLFDSGLGGSIITAAAADRLELPSWGETFVGGFGGPPAPAPFRQGLALQLGPLLLEYPTFIEQPDMGKADAMLEGEKCAGALGWDVFLRAVVEVDPTAGSVRLHDPARFDDAGVSWQEVALHWQVPYLPARFEGERSGWFGLDTGAGGLTVLFHHQAALRLGLLDGEVEALQESRGARGSFRRGERELAWFEVGGRRHAPARVHLSLAEDGEQDPYADGFLGSGFFDGQVFVFDHQGSRVGLRPRD